MLAILRLQYLVAFLVAVVLRLNKLLVLAGLCRNLPWIMVPWYTATTAVVGAALGVPLPVDLRGEFVALFSQLHRDVPLAGGRLAEGIIDVADIRVTEGRGSTRLLFESGDAPLIVRKLERKQLECDVAAKADVARQPDFTHPAGPERPNQFVGV